MNPLAWLQVPWRSSHRSMRWLSVLVFALCSIGAIVVALLDTDGGRWIGAIAVYGFGLVFLWAFFLSTGLLLAIDTRQLRVPGVQRQVVLGLLSYGVLSIGAPACAMAFLELPAWNCAITLALFSVSGLLFALMPRFVAVFIGMLPSLLMAIWRRFDLPGLGDPRFAHWTFFVVLLLLLAVILRWRQLLLAGPNASLGWSSPMVIQFRNGSWGQWNNIGDNRMLRQRPDWLRPVLDLDDAGPANPRKAIRVALGGWYLPQTTRSLIKQWSIAAFFIVVPGLASGLLSRMGATESHAAIAMKGAILGAFGSLSVIAGPMISLLTMVWISKRWQRPNAELPLMALLPGLGDTTHIKRLLMRVGSGMPLVLHALLVLPVVLAMLFWPGHMLLLSFALVAQLGAATITAAIMLNLFGGRALGTAAVNGTIAAEFALTLSSLLVPALMLGSHPASWTVSLLPVLAFGWLTLFATMVWLGRRGWNNLMSLPHAFLMH